MTKSNFIIIDGIDGSGKSTIINTWANVLQTQGKKIFHLKNYWLEHHTHPSSDEIIDYDVIISAEPTHVWIGSAIRNELIQNDRNYSAYAIADAFALDRLILYKRLILPLREAGKIIIQDRSVSTSLCYQSIQKNPLTQEEIARREGNAFALSHAPDHFIIADVSIENALMRLGERSNKQDNAIFEKKDFLEKARTIFLDKTFQNYFTQHNANVHILDCNPSIDIVSKNATKLLFELLQT